MYTQSLCRRRRRRRISGPPRWRRGYRGTAAADLKFLRRIAFDLIGKYDGFRALFFCRCCYVPSADFFQFGTLSVGRRVPVVSPVL